jgi:hypothetical protein
VPALEKELPNLAVGPMVWRVRFEGHIGDRPAPAGQPRPSVTFDDAKARLRFDEREPNSITIIANADFEEAFHHAENIAEHALVYRTVEGFAALAGTPLTPERLNEVTQQIVGDTSARQTHAFMARRFRDFVRRGVWRHPITVNSNDTALVQLGLGWRVRDRALGSAVEGKPDCTAFLNDVVRCVEDDLCEALQELDRSAVVMFALQNHEAAIADRDLWRRTSAAVMALHADKDATRSVIAKREFQLNMVFQATRILIEFAICESPLTGGRKPGRLDISRLMAMVAEISGLGGWSDAIFWDAMQPTLRVTPLGDVHANVSFEEQVIEPYSRMGIDLTLEESIKNYSKNIDEIEPRETDKDAIAAAFLEALEEEFRASLDLIRRFIDAVENLGIEKNRAIFVVSRSAFLAEIAQEMACEVAMIEPPFDRLTLSPRPSWRTPPEGYLPKDLFPWRFRRPLTVLRRPFIQVDDAGERIFVAPGILRDAISYMMHNFHQGNFPLRQLKPKMKRWAGESRNQQGRKFAEEVAARLNELGWMTDVDIKVTALLKKGFDKDYGDVDVIAYNPVTKRVLLIECKDVQHRKTPGEIAEQLSDFRGDLGDDGKPDHLLRHLARIDLIKEHTSDLAKHVGFDGPYIEGHIVFKNPVPMKFVWDRLEERISLRLFSELQDI